MALTEHPAADLLPHRGDVRVDHVLGGAPPVDQADDPQVRPGIGADLVLGGPCSRQPLEPVHQMAHPLHPRALQGEALKALQPLHDAERRGAEGPVPGPLQTDHGQQVGLQPVAFGVLRPLGREPRQVLTGTDVAPGQEGVAALGEVEVGRAARAQEDQRRDVAAGQAALLRVPAIEVRDQRGGGGVRLQVTLGDHGGAGSGSPGRQLLGQVGAGRGGGGRGRLRQRCDGLGALGGVEMVRQPLCGRVVVQECLGLGTDALFEGYDGLQHLERGEALLDEGPRRVEVAPDGGGEHRGERPREPFPVLYAGGLRGFRRLRRLVGTRFGNGRGSRGRRRLRCRVRQPVHDDPGQALHGVVLVEFRRLQVQAVALVQQAYQVHPEDRVQAQVGEGHVGGQAGLRGAQDLRQPRGDRGGHRLVGGTAGDRCGWRSGGARGGGGHEAARRCGSRQRPVGVRLRGRCGGAVQGGQPHLAAARCGLRLGRRPLGRFDGGLPALS